MLFLNFKDECYQLTAIPNYKYMEKYDREEITFCVLCGMLFLMKGLGIERKPQLTGQISGHAGTHALRLTARDCYFLY